MSILHAVLLMFATQFTLEDAPAKPAAGQKTAPGAQPPAVVQPAPTGTPVEGTIQELTKDEDTPTGSVTIVDSTGKSTKFLVGVATQFELLRGTVVHPSNFLREHRGERARIFPLAGSDMLAAAKVQILLPPAGKPHLYFAHGTVTSVSSTAVTIQLYYYHPKPVAPVVGIVKDVQFNQDTQIGTMTVEADGQMKTYSVNPWTRFIKVKDQAYQPTNFLDEYRGQTVVVHLAPENPQFAVQVDIVLAGMVPAQDFVRRHGHRHFLTFQLNANTEYEFVRDGKHMPAQFSNLAVGETVGILPTGFHTGVAKHVNIHLPHALHGEITDLTANTLTLRRHHHATLDSPAHDVIVSVPLLASTKYQTVDDQKNTTDVAFAAMKKGEHVIVYRGPVLPFPAERVEILRARKHTAVRGILSSMASGSIVVTVKHAAKDGKAATTTKDTFQVNMNTNILFASNQQPGVMFPGDDVTVFAPAHASGVTPTADRIEVRPTAAKAVTVHGSLLSSGNGAITVNVNHGSKKNPGAAPGQETFQLSASTVIVLAGTQTAATLMPGDELTIHAQSRGGFVGSVDKIEVKRKKAKTK